MAFTDEERRAWHEAKRRRETAGESFTDGIPAAVCVHCGNAFAWSDGVVTDEVALCDICNGD